MKRFWVLFLIMSIIAGCAPASISEPTSTPTETETALPQSTETPLAKTTPTTSDVTACSSAKMVFHPPSKQVLLIGCVAQSSRSTIPNVVWGWDGKQWQIVTEGGPSMRVLAGAAYDTDRDKLVIYGGQNLDTGKCVRETWEWDGSTWAQISANSPTACDHFEMVYDEGQERVLLFGGQDENRKAISETWSWDGTTWEQVSSEGPQGRAHFGFVNDPTHNQTLVYGGYFGKIFDDFWSLRENAWQKVELSNNPGTLSHFGMAYDSDVNSLIIFGGATSPSTFRSLNNKTWVLNGDYWVEKSVTITPSPRGSPAMTYDPNRKKIVLYGGFGADRNDKNDTWEWDGTNWVCVSNCE